MNLLSIFIFSEQKNIPSSYRSFIIKLLYSSSLINVSYYLSSLYDKGSCMCVLYLVSLCYLQVPLIATVYTLNYILLNPKVLLVLFLPVNCLLQPLRKSIKSSFLINYGCGISYTVLFVIYLITS